MGRSLRCLGLGLALVFAMPQLSACSGCSGNTALPTQEIESPDHLEPAELEPSDAPFTDPVPGAGIPCQTAMDCDDGNPCTEAQCVDAICAFEALPVDLCCEATPLQALGFDDPDAKALDADAPFGGAAWARTDARAVSAPNSLYFGDPESLTLGQGERVIGALRFPSVVLPPETPATITMRLFVDIEAALHRDQLNLFADVLDESGAVAAVVPLMGKVDIPLEAYAGFALIELPLDDLMGQTIRLRLDFDSVEGPSPGSEGVFVDDVEIRTTCPEGVPTDELSNPGDDLTAGLSGADEGDGEQPDPEGEENEGEGQDDPETFPGGSLVSGGPATDEGNPCDAPDAHEGCCTSDADCDDGNPATVNVCEGAECVAGWNPDGCTADEDCDDAESCTLDSCVDSQCVHEGTFGTLCCEEGAMPLADFDTESLQGFYVTDNLETGVFWRTDPTRGTSGDFALYCGEPVAQTYGIGERVKSSATTPLLALPVGGQTHLIFDLFMLTRPAQSVDVFQVLVLRDGALTTAWSSKVLPGGNTTGFETVEVDLSNFAGQEIQLRFVFDSVDAHAPAVEGTYIDSMRLETTCL